MRHATELSANLRGLCLSPTGWGAFIHDGTINGGSGKMLPSALAVLAVAEARFIFLLVKLSGCTEEQGGPDEPRSEAAGTALPGSDSQA